MPEVANALQTQISQLRKVLPHGVLQGRPPGYVLAVDRGKYGTDTLSTHALMRGGVLQLHRWGVLPAVIAGGAVPVRVTTFFYGGEPLAIPMS